MGLSTNMTNHCSTNLISNHTFVLSPLKWIQISAYANKIFGQFPSPRIANLWLSKTKVQIHGVSTLQLQMAYPTSELKGLCTLWWMWRRNKTCGWLVVLWFQAPSPPGPFQSTCFISAVQTQACPVVWHHQEILVHGFTESSPVQLWGDHGRHFTWDYKRAKGKKEAVT